MKRIPAVLIAALTLGAAAPVAAQSWVVVHELEGTQGVVACGEATRVPPG